MSLKVKLLEEDAQLPFRATPNSAGLDLYCYETVTIPAESRIKCRTAIAVAIPVGYYGEIGSRSSLGLKGIEAFIGRVDSDYRDEIGVIMINYTKQDFTINKGERIAQLIIIKIALPDVEQVEELDETERKGGFGSTNTI